MKQEIFRSNTRLLVKRDSRDRRDRYFNSFLYSMNKGSRITARRQTEGVQGYYTDSYEKRIGVCIIAITLLSVLDAFFTLNILAKGGVEVNPFMSALLAYDTSVFIIGKLVITITGLLIVLVHINFQILKIFSMKAMLVSIFAGYVLLIGYELLLLAMI